MSRTATALWMVYSLLLIALSSEAGLNRWTSGGATVGVIDRLFVDPQDPSIVFALAAGGVYKSTDAGQNWRPANDGLPQSANSAPLLLSDSGSAPMIGSFLITANKTAYLSIGTEIFASRDDGDHWRRRAVFGGPVAAMAYDPRSGSLIAGTFACCAPAISVSNDDGRSWQNASIPANFHGDDGTGSGATATMVVSADAVYAADSGFFMRSADAGRTWQPILVPGSSGSSIDADPSTNSVYHVTSEMNVILVSKDGGASWSSLPALPVQHVNSVKPAGDSVFAATDQGVFVYDAAAGSWSSVGSKPGSVHSLAVVSTAPRHLYAALDHGVASDVDGAGDWTLINAGLPGPLAVDVGMAATVPSVAYTATSLGVFRTTDGAKSWTSVNSALADNTAEIVVSPDSADSVYAASLYYNGVLRSHDGGATWTQVLDGVQHLQFAPSDSKTLYALFANNAMAISKDVGESWLQIKTDLPETYDFYGLTPMVTSMAVSPASTSDLVASNADGFFKSSNGGAHWQKVSSTESYVRALTFDRSNPSIIFGGRDGGGFVRSDDGGVTWTRTLDDASVRTIALSGTTLYAGTAQGHIYRSDDGGRRWIGFDDGLLGALTRIVVDPSGNHLYASTTAGVFAYDIANGDIAPARLAADPGRLADLVDRVMDARTSHGASVVPVAGRVRGAGGTLFTTELTLANGRTTPQDLFITWLPQGGNGGAVSFALTLPPADGGPVKFMDAAGRFGMEGLGSLLVLAVDASGHFDPGASISASTRIWSLATNRTTPVAQSIPSADVMVFSEHGAARATSLEHDAAFRTNSGIVNLSAAPHRFTIDITGMRASGRFTVDVPPFALAHVPIPDADYGELSLDVSADSAKTRWLLYGSSVDRVTGEAYTSLGIPPD